MKAGVTELARRAPGAKVGAVGFCARYNATAAAQAYRRVLDWFGRYLA